MLKILPIMLYAALLKIFTYFICSNYAQVLCLISYVLLINLQLWVHNKWLNNIFALQNMYVTEKIDIL